MDASNWNFYYIFKRSNTNCRPSFIKENTKITEIQRTARSRSRTIYSLVYIVYNILVYIV